MTEAYHKFIANQKLRRFVVLAFIVFGLWLIRSMLSIVLLTFVFTYLVVHFVMLLNRHTKIPVRLLVILTYVAIVALLYLGVVNYLPQLVDQIIKMVNSVVKFYHNNNTTVIDNFIDKYISTSSITNQVKNSATVVLKYVTTVGSMGMTLFLSFVLSLFYSLELKQLKRFSENYKTGDFAWFFGDIEYFARKFVNTFGVVIGAQFSIAIANTIITTVCLMFMGMPQILSLSLMVFLFSLVPVAGVIVSSVPLSIIAYSVGGVREVIYVLIMIVAVHAFETYVLNPHFMASRTELPVFYTFVVLLIGEHFFGVWGLIVGVPIFVFLLDVLDVKPIAHAQQKPPSDN